MFNVEIVRTYRDEGSSYEYKDKVYLEVDSLEKINEILSADKRLPQEIINYEVLKNNSR